MGFLKKAVLIGLGATLEHMESEKTMKREPSLEIKLYVEKGGSLFKKGFSVLDEEKKKKYHIKTDLFSFGCLNIRVYNNNNEEIGRIKHADTLNPMRIPYEIYVHDKKIGTIVQKVGLTVKLDLDFKGWHLEGNLLQYDFTVYDANNEIVMRIRNIKGSGYKYVVLVENPEDELIGMLLAITIDYILTGE